MLLTIVFGKVICVLTFDNDEQNSLELWKPWQLLLHSPLSLILTLFVSFSLLEQVIRLFEMKLAMKFAMKFGMKFQKFQNVYGANDVDDV